MRRRLRAMCLLGFFLLSQDLLLLITQACGLLSREDILGLMASSFRWRSGCLLVEQLDFEGAVWRDAHEDVRPPRLNRGRQRASGERSEM